ncbi:33881_t:CDS:2, partial [Racocetra persica]
MATEPALLTAIRRLQSPIPQYILGTLPAITIMGATPHKAPLALCEDLTCEVETLQGYTNIKHQPIRMKAGSNLVLRHLLEVTYVTKYNPYLTNTRKFPLMHTDELRTMGRVMNGELTGTQPIEVYGAISRHHTG